MTSARDEVLRAIRLAAGGATPTRAADYDRVTREYRKTGSLDAHEVRELFLDRLRDYGCGVYECRAGEIAGTVARILSEKGKSTLLVSPDICRDWLSDQIRFVRDENLPYAAIDESEGVLTGCAVAIAFTGTIILTHAAERRALTLIPDYHLCVVFEDQIVETVPEAFAKMRAFATTPITTISGPSATADIEMTRVKGVHGPRSLDVVVASRV
jgi:L-lactate dehydrogenase complex protein LldG